MSTKITIEFSSHILVMGVSGCGKSSVSKVLSEHFGLIFLEGDDFHPQANIDKMSAGDPLNDKDRKPWLENLNREMLRNKQGSVLSCSALKSKYRKTLKRDLDSFTVVFLKGDFQLINDRMNQRKDHFMPSKLLQSQFDALEEPTDCIIVDISKSIEDITQEIISQITNQNQEQNG